MLMTKLLFSWFPRLIFSYSYKEHINNSIVGPFEMTFGSTIGRKYCNVIAYNVIQTNQKT